MDNLTSDCFLPPPVSSSFTFIRACAFILVIVISLIGNAVVLLVIYRTDTMRTVTNLLICNSALADLLITLYPTVWEVVDGLILHGKWPLGSFMCVFMCMCVYLSVAATIITLMIITVDRFCAVRLPCKKYLKKKHLRFVVPAIWFCALCFASPTIYIQKVIFYKGYGDLCVEIWREPFDERESPKYYTIILFVFLYVVPLSIMTVMYAMMANKLRKNGSSSKKDYAQSEAETSPCSTNQERIPLDKKKPSAKKRNLMWKKRRVIKMLVSIVIVFAICWLPVYCIQFLKYFHPYFSRCPESIPEWALFVAYFMQYANSAINPLIYIGFSQSYRKGFQKSFSCFF